MAGKRRIDTTATWNTIIDRYGYSDVFDNESTKKAFGKFVEYVKSNIYDNLYYEAEEVVRMFAVSRRRIGQEMLLNQYNLFAEEFDTYKSDAENLRSLLDVKRSIVNNEAPVFRDVTANRWRDRKTGRFIKNPFR